MLNCYFKLKVLNVSRFITGKWRLVFEWRTFKQRVLSKLGRRTNYQSSSHCQQQCTSYIGDGITPIKVDINWAKILKCFWFDVSQETTSSDPDENDSAIERSYSPTPDRDEPKDEKAGFSFALGQLSAASSSLAKSKNNLLNFFSSSMSLANAGGKSKTLSSIEVLQVNKFRHSFR